MEELNSINKDLNYECENYRKLGRRRNDRENKNLKMRKNCF